ncbi:hypothetical protein ABPG75_012332 [Micractinium tetrahymenae]
MASASASEASRLVGRLRRHIRPGTLAAGADACFDLSLLCQRDPSASCRVIAAGGMEALAECMAAVLGQHPSGGPSSAGLEAAALATSMLLQHCDQDARRAALAAGAVPSLVAMLRYGGPTQQAEAVQVAAAALLTHLTEYSEECSAAVLSAPGDAVSRLVQLLTASSSDGMRLETTMCLLNNLVVCGGEQAHWAFVNAGGLSALSGILARGSSIPSTTTLFTACGIATKLTFMSGLRVTALAACGAIPALAPLLCHRDAAVAAKAASALYNLTADSSERCAAAVEAGAIPPLLHLLRQPTDSPTVLEAAHLLHGLASDAEDACKLITQLGGTAILQHLVGQTDASSELGRTAAERTAILAAFSGVCEQGSATPVQGAPTPALSSSPAAPAAQLRPMASAASEASKASRLVSQLRRHARGGNRPAAAAAGQELDRLCGSSPAASRRALAEGGMEAVAEYIAAELRQQPARAPSSSGLDAAAHVVVSLVNHCGGEAHAAALACRLIPGLVAMLNCGGLPRDAAPVQRAAAAALSYLTEYSRECSGAVLGERGGAVSRLVQLLSLSSDECSFEAAMCTLNNLMVCSGEEAKQAFVDAGGLTAMTNELSMPSGMPATTGMLIPACSAAARLASSPGSHAEALAACGAIPALVRLLRHQDTVVAAQASDALFNLAQSSPERCAATLEAGAIPPLLHLLRRPAESPTNLAASKAEAAEASAAAEAAVIEEEGL